MLDGKLYHRTRARRVAVRPDVLPEYVASLTMHLVWVKRRLAAAIEAARIDPTAGAGGELRRYTLMAECLEEIIARSADTFDEVEFALCLVGATREVRRALATPRPRGGRRLGIPQHVPALVTGGRR